MRLSPEWIEENPNGIPYENTGIRNKSHFVLTLLPPQDIPGVMEISKPRGLVFLLAPNSPERCQSVRVNQGLR